MQPALLVIGYGSIGARHSRLAQSLGVKTAYVSRNPNAPEPRFYEIREAVARFTPSHVLIANETGRHAQTLSALVQAGFTGRVLVEKPLVADSASLVTPSGMNAYVAYNLRFHPLLKELKTALGGRPLFTASFHAGQYLPQWRPGVDYRDSYSASRTLGGGVLRDLSHEIDLAYWLCGRARQVTALGGHFSDLEIASDDAFSILAVHEHCPSVSISINYLDRSPRRSISINAEGLTGTLDMIAGTLSLNGEQTSMTVDRDTTYINQLAAFFSDDPVPPTLCSYAQAEDIVRFIEAAETASADRRWLTL